MHTRSSSRKELEFEKAKEMGLKKCIEDGNLFFVKLLLRRNMNVFVLPTYYCPCCLYEREDSDILYALDNDMFDIFKVLVEEGIYCKDQYDFVLSNIPNDCDEKYKNVLLFIKASVINIIGYPINHKRFDI